MIRKDKFMRSKLSALVLGLSLSPVALAASSVDQKLQDQQIEIDTLSKELKRLKSAIALNSALDKASDDNVAEFMERMDFSAFITAGISRTDQKQEYRVGGISNEWNFHPQSIFGAQITFKVNDKFDIVTQLVARGKSENSPGRNDWQVEADWAYLAYKPVANLQIRAGRLRLPLYLYSDYLEVGYAYPWVSPPTEVYYEDEITTFDGIDVVYDWAINDSWNLTTQAFYGSLNDTITRYNPDLDIDLTTEISINRDMGINFSLSDGRWTFRIGHVDGVQDTRSYNANEGFAIPVPGVPEAFHPIEITADDVDFTFDEIGVKYEGEKLLFISEVIRFDIDAATSASTESGYMTLGYRFGKWLPHVTYAKMHNVDDSQLGPGSKTVQDSVTIGTRFDVAENVALKAEVKKIENLEGTKGLFLAPLGEDEAYVYNLVVDATF